MRSVEVRTAIVVMQVVEWVLRQQVAAVQYLALSRGCDRAGIEVNVGEQFRNSGTDVHTVGNRDTEVSALRYRVERGKELVRQQQVAGSGRQVRENAVRSVIHRLRP